ncbi:hypothetical protein Ddye_010280 [Dipteronia dyeriana]|uniref:RNA helicase n=1 Tax=Dipteronia dyeriana TaxID=168575 RepID=A0AAD9XD90_9ROSI|nr:hypothetical protein Ddye_010280 [Dipteronia dyeriana]
MRCLGSRIAELITCPIYANLPAQLQTKIFDPVPDGVRKVVLATNIAETSLTVDGINLGIDDLTNFDFIDPPLVESLIKALEPLFALGALNKYCELTKTGRRMAEFPLDPMLSKVIVASDKYVCSNEIITIVAMLSVGNSIFYCPKDKKVHANNARMNFHLGNVGDHISLLRVYNSWRECNYSIQWCHENYIRAKSMKRARDPARGSLKKVEIENKSDPNDLDSIRKAITSGFFPHCARLQKKWILPDRKTSTKNYPSSGLAQELPQWVVYHKLVLTTKEYMRQVTQLKPEWLVEIAPRYYQLKDVEDPASKKDDSSSKNGRKSVLGRHYYYKCIIWIMLRKYYNYSSFMPQTKLLCLLGPLFLCRLRSLQDCLVDPSKDCDSLGSGSGGFGFYC